MSNVDLKEDTKAEEIGKSIEKKTSPRQEQAKSIGHYILGITICLKLGKSIGEGTFGKVKLGTHILTNEKVLQW
jgi:hypothetical protein